MSKSQLARFVKWKAPINEECSDADFVCHSGDAVRERRHSFKHHVYLLHHFFIDRRLPLYDCRDFVFPEQTFRTG